MKSMVVKKHVKTFAMILSILMLFAFTAQAQKVDTIRFWTNDMPQKPVWDKIIEQFNETIGQQKGIKAEMTVYGADYNDTIRLAIASGQAPEIFKQFSDVVTAKNAGYIIPISDLPGADEFLAGYEGNLLPVKNIIDDKVWCVPFKANVAKMVYNKDLFAKAGVEAFPKTWQEFREAAKKITAVGEGNAFGYVVALKENSMLEWELTAMFVPSVGHYGFDFKEGRYAWSDFAPILKILAGVVEDKSMVPGYIGFVNDTARANFANGTAAMKATASWDAATFAKQFVPEFEWGVADVPVLDAENRFKEYARPSIIGYISSSIQDETIKAKTFELYKFLNSPTSSKMHFEGGTATPYSMAVVQGATPPDTKNFADFSDTTKSVFYIDGPNSVIKVEGDSMDLVYQKILTGVVTDIDAALADADARYNDALDRAITDGSVDKNNYIDPNMDVSLK